MYKITNMVKNKLNMVQNKPIAQRNFVWGFIFFFWGGVYITNLMQIVCISF